jgi:hypothetical protein
MPDADSALTIELVEQAGDWGGIATGSIIDTGRIPSCTCSRCVRGSDGGPCG